MLELIKPELEEMSFRESLMADEETMSYNAKWGGTITFPKDKWNSWYDAWVRNPGKDRFYRYLQNEEKEYVGEILAKYRKRGYGSEGIKLLCQAAKENGISILHDDIAADNPSYKLFLKNGFEIEYRNEEVVMVKKAL